MKMTGPNVGENKMEEKSEKRLFVGGLFPDVKPEDLCQRFAQYGTIKGTEIKIRKDDNGLPFKTFAYIDLETTNTELRKCMNAYKKARWHGRELKVEIAKDNFMKRLEKERQEMVDEKEKQRATTLESGIPRQVPSLSDKATAGNFDMRGATPGTKIPGQENWIVGKYGRVLPVVNLKKNGSSKLLKVDPSKLTHNVRKIKDENNSDSIDPCGLTWQLDEDEKEISRKRKGEFPEWILPQSKRKRNGSGDQNEKDVRQRLMAVVESDRKYRNTDFEVVPVSGKTGTQFTDGKSGNKITDINRFDSDLDDSDNSSDVGCTLDLSRFNSDSENEASDFGQNRTWSEKSNKKVTHSSEENWKKWKTPDSFSSIGDRKAFGIPNFVDEYSSGLAEVCDSGNVSVDGRNKNTASDGDEDDDDFEAFVKRELKKVELQRSKPIGTLHSQKEFVKPQIDTQKESYRISSVNNQCSDREQTGQDVSDEIKPTIIEGKKTLPAFRGTKFLSSENRSISCSLEVDKNSLSGKKHPKTVNNVLLENMTTVKDKIKLRNTSTSVKREQKPNARSLIPSHIVKPKLLLDEFSSGLEATDNACINDSSEDNEDDADSDFEKFVKRESEKIKSENKLLNLSVNTEAWQQSYENSKNVKKSLLESKNINYNSSSSSESEDSLSPVQIYKVSKELMKQKHGTKKDVLYSKAYTSHSSTENDAHDEVDSDDEDDSDYVDNEDGLVEVDNEDDSEEIADEDGSEDIADVDDLNKVAENDSNKDDEDDSEEIADEDHSDEVDDSEEVDGENICDDNHSEDDNMDSSGSDFEALVSKAVQEVKNTGSLDLPKYSVSLNTSIQHKELGANKDIRPVDISETKNLHGGKKRLTLGGIGDVSESSDSDDDTDIESESSVKNTEERSSFSSDTAGKKKSDAISEIVREKLKVSTECPSKSEGNKNDILQGNELKQTDVKSEESAVKVAKSPVLKDGTTTSKTRQASNSKAKHSAKSSRVEDKAVVDKKRLEAVKQRHKENMAQKSAIKCALSNLDVKKKVNTKIVFDSDNEEDQVTMKTNENEPNSLGDELSEEQITKSKTLFDSDDEDDVSDVNRFSIREEFEGEEGRKLAKLQARFGHDERFKLDARFIESGSDDDEEEKIEEEDETTRSMKILQSIVGAKAVGGLHKQDKAKKKFKDIGALIYDPSREEHQQFEVKNQQIEEPKGEGNKKKKGKKKEAAGGGEEPGVVLPEVSAERFHEISDSLKSAFVAKDSVKTSSGSGFSLLAAFGKNDDIEDKNDGFEDSAIPIPRSLRTNQLSLDNRFNVKDDVRASDSDMEVDNTDDKSTGGESETDIEDQSTDQASPVTQSRTFFFTQNNKYSKDGVTLPNKPGTDSMKADWFQKRRHLIASYKSKHKNFRRKKGTAGHKRGGKRR